jgi:hypothetical protein
MHRGLKQGVCGFKLSPCFESKCMYSFGYFPGVWLKLKYADVSELSISSIFKGWMWGMKYFKPHIQPLKMELIECSKTSAYCNFNQTPGKYPKEYIHLDSKHGESLKSRIDLSYLCIIITNYYDIYFIVKTHSVLCLLLPNYKFYISSGGSLQY